MLALVNVDRKGTRRFLIRYVLPVFLSSLLEPSVCFSQIWFWTPITGYFVNNTFLACFALVSIFNHITNFYPCFFHNFHTWGIPPQIDQAITPYISDFDETLSVGLSWALILAVTFSASSVKWFTRYRPRQLPGADKN